MLWTHLLFLGSASGVSAAQLRSGGDLCNDAGKFPEVIEKYDEEEHGIDLKTLSDSSVRVGQTVMDDPHFSYHIQLKWSPKLNKHVWLVSPDGVPEINKLLPPWSQLDPRRKWFAVHEVPRAVLAPNLINLEFQITKTKLFSLVDAQTLTIAPPKRTSSMSSLYYEQKLLEPFQRALNIPNVDEGTQIRLVNDRVVTSWHDIEQIAGEDLKVKISYPWYVDIPKNNPERFKSLFFDRHRHAPQAVIFSQLPDQEKLLSWEALCKYALLEHGVNLNDRKTRDIAIAVDLENNYMGRYSRRSFGDFVNQWKDHRVLQVAPGLSNFAKNGTYQEMTGGELNVPRGLTPAECSAFHDEFFPKISAQMIGEDVKAHRCPFVEITEPADLHYDKDRNVFFWHRDDDYTGWMVGARQVVHSIDDYELDSESDTLVWSKHGKFQGWVLSGASKDVQILIDDVKKIESSPKHSLIGQQVILVSRNVWRCGELHAKQQAKLKTMENDIATLENDIATCMNDLTKHSVALRAPSVSVPTVSEPVSKHRWHMTHGRPEDGELQPIQDHGFSTQPQPLTEREFCERHPSCFAFLISGADAGKPDEIKRMFFEHEDFEKQMQNVLFDQIDGDSNGNAQRPKMLFRQWRFGHYSFPKMLDVNEEHQFHFLTTSKTIWESPMAYTGNLEQIRASCYAGAGVDLVLSVFFGHLETDIMKKSRGHRGLYEDLRKFIAAQYTCSHSDDGGQHVVVAKDLLSKLSKYFDHKLEMCTKYSVNEVMDLVSAGALGIVGSLRNYSGDKASKDIGHVMFVNEIRVDDAGAFSSVQFKNSHGPSNPKPEYSALQLKKGFHEQELTGWTALIADQKCSLTLDWQLKAREAVVRYSMDLLREWFVRIQPGSLVRLSLAHSSNMLGTFGPFEISRSDFLARLANGNVAQTRGSLKVTHPFGELQHGDIIRSLNGIDRPTTATMKSVDSQKEQSSDDMWKVVVERADLYSNVGVVLSGISDAALGYVRKFESLDHFEFLSFRKGSALDIVGSAVPYSARGVRVLFGTDVQKRINGCGHPHPYLYTILWELDNLPEDLVSHMKGRGLDAFRLQAELSDGETSKFQLELLDAACDQSDKNKNNDNDSPGCGTVGFAKPLDVFKRDSFGRPTVSEGSALQFSKLKLINTADKSDVLQIFNGENHNRGSRRLPVHAAWDPHDQRHWNPKIPGDTTPSPNMT